MQEDGNILVARDVHLACMNPRVLQLVTVAKARWKPQRISLLAGSKLVLLSKYYFSIIHKLTQNIESFEICSTLCTTVLHRRCMYVLEKMRQRLRENSLVTE